MGLDRNPDISLGKLSVDPSGEVAAAGQFGSYGGGLGPPLLIPHGFQRSPLCNGAGGERRYSKLARCGSRMDV
ncbi:MAG: hypothetical protein ACRD3T_20130 [Terriglobia bacterium]